MDKQIDSRGWNIKPEVGDTKEQIKTKNKIKKVLMMSKDKKDNKEIVKETGFSEGAVIHILLREVTFILG